MALDSSLQQSNNTDFETSNPSAQIPTINRENLIWSTVKYLGAGIFFGILLIKAEVVSWYRIQEMFRFQSFHMYGVIGSAVAVGALSVWVLKRFKVKSISGEAIQTAERTFHKGTIFGGLLFGFGWALTGACPGPLFALIGNGAYVFVVSLASAVAGTWLYGALQNKLPH